MTSTQPTASGSAPGRSSTPPPPTLAELDDNPRRQKILVCGERRSGKTSILKVLFHDMSPRDTFRFIPPTHETRVENVEVFAPFQIWDVPGTKDLRLSAEELRKFAAVIWVVDAINNYDDLFEQIAAAFCAAHAANPLVKLFVFVHKADGLTHDAAQDAFKDLQTEISNEIPYHLPSSSSDDNDMPQPSFHLSSIYDYRLPLAFSSVVQRILPPAPYLAGLLDSFVTASSVFKSFLVERRTRVFVATDTAPVQDSIYNVLQEWVKKMGAFEGLFESVLSHQAQEPSAKALADGLFPTAVQDPASPGTSADGANMNGEETKTTSPGEPRQDDIEYESLSEEDSEEDVDDDDSDDGGEEDAGSAADHDKQGDKAALSGVTALEDNGRGNGNRVPLQEVHLASGLTLVCWEMTPKLALVGIIRTEHYKAYRPRIDNGVDAVRRAVRQYVVLASGGLGR